MRKEFYQQNEESTKKYLTRAARYFDSIQNGTPLADGSVLKGSISATERFEFMEYLMSVMNPIIVRVVECESKASHLTPAVQETLLSRVYEMIMTDFGSFNNRKDDPTDYSLETFIKSRLGDIIRNSVAEEQGIGVNRSRQRSLVFKTRSAIAIEKQIDEDQVQVDDICERINAENEKKNAARLSRRLVMELLELEKGFVSTSEMEENGEQLGELQHGLTTEFDTEMDYGTAMALNEAFCFFSGLDYYILMKEFGFYGEEFRNQEMVDFVEEPMFKKLFEMDETIRSKTDPVRTAYNKKIKIKKALASLNGKVNMADLVGTIEPYIEGKLAVYVN